MSAHPVDLVEAIKPRVSRITRSLVSPRYNESVLAFLDAGTGTIEIMFQAKRGNETEHGIRFVRLTEREGWLDAEETWLARPGRLSSRKGHAA